MSGGVNRFLPLTATQFLICTSYSRADQKLTIHPILLSDQVMPFASLALYKAALQEFKGLLPNKSLHLLNVAISSVIAEAKEEARREMKHTKLSDDEVKEIRNSDESCRVLAARYGVHRATISKIKTGVWRSFE